MDVSLPSPSPASTRGGQLRARVGLSHRAPRTAARVGGAHLLLGWRKKGTGPWGQEEGGRGQFSNTSQVGSCNPACHYKRAAVSWTASLGAGSSPGPSQENGKPLGLSEVTSLLPPPPSRNRGSSPPGARLRLRSLFCVLASCQGNTFSVLICTQPGCSPSRSRDLSPSAAIS